MSEQRAALKAIAGEARLSRTATLVLLAGAAGTAATLAADVLAGELGGPVYRVELSAIVSRYIGETEKNLDRVLAEAAASRAVLLLDEADALFGRRTDVGDSHDRFANLDAAALLARLEIYPGVVLLATGATADVDPAVSRRLRHRIHYPPA